jgi:hypothetical protein
LAESLFCEGEAMATREDPRNADRTLWGTLAVVTFAGINRGRAENVETGSETVLSELLSNLVHQCDAQKTSGGRRIVSELTLHSRGCTRLEYLVHRGW